MKEVGGEGESSVLRQVDRLGYFLLLMSVSFCVLSCFNENSVSIKQSRRILKMKKRTLAMLLACLLLAVSLTACGDTGTTTDTSTDEQTTTQTEQAEQTDTQEPEETVSKEFENALKKADQYANDMHMSKKGVYEQLTSEYGEQFPEDAAQYAIDNVKADWNANALAKAKDYQESMSMSKNAIYDQLTSEYGEQFTADEAQYAVDNLD